MDRFVVRESRAGAEYPQGNHMIAFPAHSAVGSNMIPPETMYFGGPFASEFPNAHHNMGAQNDMNSYQNMNVQHSMSAHQNMGAHHNLSAQQNMGAQHNMGAHHNLSAQQNMGAQHNMNAQQNMGAHHNMSAQQNMGAQHNTSAHRNMSAQHNMNAQHNMVAQRNMNLQMVQDFGTDHVARQMHGIDPRYLAGYSDNSAHFIVTGQQIQSNATPTNRFGSDYQNRSFAAVDRNKSRSFAPQPSTESPRFDALPKPQPQSVVARHKTTENTPKNYAVAQPKKPNELDLLRNDIQNQIVTRADKLKALYKTGPRTFTGPVEKVLKWHKSLQDIGVLILYEIVAKCVSVRAGEPGSKVLVVRDDSGPAMQVVYYEIDFFLPELKPPCTVRVVGRMMTGTCRLQAFNVRVATGDDVATLPRRAAVATHHVTKLCKEYGNNSK